ncbi:MAG TPA: hypothetical protein V6D06_06270 [Trichocoleus sp.]
MAYDVSQWLAEIRTLQRQLADAQKERDQAYTSAANWRRLYETEARQRRTEVEELRSHLQTLEAQLKQAQTNSSLLNELPTLGRPQSAETNEPLKAQVDETLRLCQSLKQQLEAERAAHAQTRQTLTTALGDTFDMLKPEKPAAIAKAQAADSK